MKRIFPSPFPFHRITPLALILLILALCACTAAPSGTETGSQAASDIPTMPETAAPVYAAAKGKVKQIADDPLWGKCVWIEHDGDAVSIYRGLDDTLADGIEVGAKVSEGTLLGAVGEGGVLELAEEPHLHFEMKVGGEDADPLEYFSKSSLEILARKPEKVYED